MGKKKGFNWRGRQVVNTVIDDSKTEQIKLELGGSNKQNYDSCNALVLPSEKRKTKVKKENVTVTKILSKTQRKRLETIVDRRKKKENRAALLEALAKVQATPEELKQLTSTSAVQTKGLRKYYQELSESKGVVPTECNSKTKLNSIKGSQKRKRLALLNDNSKKCKYDKSDPNIVGLDSSSGDESEEDSESGKEENDDKKDDEKDKEKNVKIESDTEENSVNERTNNENDKTELVLDVTEKETSLKDASVIKENKVQNIESVENKKAAIPKFKPKPVKRKPAVFVTVDRKPEIQAARLKLPILAEEQSIMETINEKDVVILAGETGSGKTTQIPQFLYEAGYAKEKMIGVTEPRRVAAISMSKRVGEEMNLSTDVVSYLIRFEGNTTNDTKIKFMTDGVLLKEIQTDFLLTKYSVIILDEAHERSVYTDILIGLLSRIVPLRRKRRIPLKLIIMSATLRIADFTENKRLFKNTPPVVKVESRQFPVTVHFNKRTNENYLKEAYSKAIKIHTQLPDGGILIFLTGQREVNTLVRKLRRAFPFRKSLETKNTTEVNNESVDYDSDDSDIELDLKKSLKTAKQKKKSKEVKLPEINLDDYSFPANGEDIESVDGSDGSDEEDDDERLALRGLHNSQPLWTLPLYSLLPGYKQAKVFEAPPEGCRLCVVTTNVAETSLTIPHIKYVVDTGKTKARLYDKVTGVSTYEITWTSKAAADQRAGRAGRTGPGHCYRLYSSAVYNDTFKDFSIPEIQQKPVDDLYLQMKCLSIDKVVNFPFPSAPDLMQLKTAEKRLTILGALEEKDDKNGYRVTPLGQAISKFPVLPRFGKMLALSHQQDLLAFTVCMVASLSIQEVLLETPIFASNEDDQKALRQKWINTRRAWAGMGNSLLLGDPMVLLRAVGAAEYANANGNLEQFCNDNGLRHKAVAEIRKLRVQLTNEIKTNMPEIDLVVDPKMAPPTDLQAKLLRQIILCGMADQVAHKVDHNKINDAQERFKWRYAYHTSEMEEPIFMHSGSVLRRNMPEWVVFQEVYESSNNKKMYMRGVTAIEPEWLPLYAPKSSNLSEPLTDPQPRYDEKSGKVYCTVTGSFGKQNWPLPTVEILFPNTMEKYKWFGKFLLEGKIFKKLEKYSDDLLSAPSIMVKTWAKLQPRTELLLKNLVSRQIDSKQKLIEEWKKDPQYLLTEYQKWLPESAHNDVALNWPPIN